MPYLLYSFNGILIPQRVGAAGSHDIGGGHLVSRPAHAGSGTVHHPLVALPGGGSFDPVSGDTSPRIAIDLGATGFLLATPGSTIKQQTDQWLGMMGVSATLVRQNDDDFTQQVATARLVVVDINRRYMHKTFMPISLQFTIPKLPWESQFQATYTSNQTVTLANGGDVKTTDAIITMTCLTNSVTSFSVTNNTTGQTISYSAFNPGGVFIGPGGQISIDCGHFTLNWAYSSIVVPTNTMTWFDFVPGNNSITISVVSNGTWSLQFILNNGWG